MKVIDPYRWMEDLNRAETKRWMKRQADEARKYLDHLPMHRALLSRIKELSNAVTTVEGTTRIGHRYYYYKLEPGANERRLCFREGLGGTERLLVDPEAFSSPGKRYSINDFSPSSDGRYVSYLISIGGAENGEIRVIETATGRDIGERIDRARYGAGAWLPDGKSFLYPRLQKLPPGAASTETYQKVRIYRHVLGTSPDEDRAVFGHGVYPNVKLAPTMIPLVKIPAGSTYAVIDGLPGVPPKLEVYVVPIQALAQDPVPWRQVASLDDEVSGDSEHGDEMYLLTYKNTPRYKIVRINLQSPDVARAEVFLPPSDTVVQDLVAAHDALYVKTLDGGPQRLWRVDYSTGKAQEIRLPVEGSVFDLSGDAQTDGVVFSSDSFTRSPVVYEYDPPSGRLRDTGLNPPHPANFANVELQMVNVKSHDGTMVPMAILHKKGLPRNRSNPTLLQGYGAYGHNMLDPVFQAEQLAWLERGGILAFAGVRGGGEYGEEWHQAGRQTTKPNTWKDFIACAEYLIAARYTAPQYLGIQSASAGGILISNSIAERPELFGAAVIKAGINNALRYETTPNGIPNVPEFGSVKNEAGFRSLLAMDGYLKVKPGLKYPAVLLMHGMNDPRVEPWMSAKLAARLQAATVSGKPVLLRLDYDLGHGIGSSKQQQIEQQADIFAFMFEQLEAASAGTQ